MVSAFRSTPRLERSVQGSPALAAVASTATSATTLARPAAATAAAAAATAAATATTAAATATTATTETAATTATARSALLCLVDHERAAVELSTVHFLNGRLCSRFIAERDEPEAPRAPGFPIGDDLGIFDGAKALESSPQTVIVGVPTQAAYEKSITHLVYSPRACANLKCRRPVTCRGWPAYGTPQQ
jgi:hypothetical protein